MQVNPNEFELEPWVVVLSSAQEQSVCTWEIQKLESEALALFSTEARASEYGAGLELQSMMGVRQLAGPDLIRLFIRSYEAGLRHAVLDPSDQTASKLFDLKTVLAAARGRLRDAKSS